MTTRDGIDQSWGFADPATAKRAGIKVVSMYLSRDPSKNATAAKIKAYHEQGIGVILNWEGFAGAPKSGAGQGDADAKDAVAQVRALIKAVGYAPKNQLSIPFSCDENTTPADYPAIDAYYAHTKAIVNAAGFLNGVYGEADICDHLHSRGLTQMEWQTYAWSGGRLSPEADFYQFQNGQTLGGASVDFDSIIHAAQLGAWWPPGHSLDSTGKDWFDLATPTDLQNAVRLVLRQELPRIAGVIRFGTPNAAYNVGNAGALIDNKGVQGAVIAAVRAQAPVTVDAKAVAEQIVSELGSEMGAAVVTELVKRLSA